VGVQIPPTASQTKSLDYQGFFAFLMCIICSFTAEFGSLISLHSMVKDYIFPQTTQVECCSQLKIRDVTVLSRRVFVIMKLCHLK
jgi:hypothetical protein